MGGGSIRMWTMIFAHMTLNTLLRVDRTGEILALSGAEGGHWDGKRDTVNSPYCPYCRL